MIGSQHLPDTAARPHEWQRQALCAHPAADPTWWEADRGETDAGKVAMAWCGRCPVQGECDVDITRIEADRPVTEVRGIVAGLDAAERKRRRSRAAGRSP